MSSPQDNKSSPDFLAPVGQNGQGLGILSNRYLEEIRNKEAAKQKLIKMSAYQKSIHELYMPKQSQKKRMEREQVQARLKTDVREKKPFENYLGFVKEMNKKRDN